MKKIIMFITLLHIICTMHAAHDCIDSSKDRLHFYALEVHVDCNHACHEDPLSKILSDGTCTQCRHRRHIRPNIFVHVTKQALKKLKPPQFHTTMSKLFHQEIEQSVEE